MTVYAAPKPIRPPKVAKVKTPRTPMKKQNKERKAARFLTDFGGEEYHAYIVGLPCDICGVTGFTVAAHLKSRGAGGKADVISPLCCSHPCATSGVLVTGCHEAFDRHDMVLRKHEPRLRELAKARWSAFTFARGIAA